MVAQLTAALWGKIDNTMQRKWNITNEIKHISAYKRKTYLRCQQNSSKRSECQFKEMNCYIYQIQPIKHRYVVRCPTYPKKQRWKPYQQLRRSSTWKTPTGSSAAQRPQHCTGLVFLWHRSEKTTLGTPTVRRPNSSLSCQVAFWTPWSEHTQRLGLSDWGLIEHLPRTWWGEGPRNGYFLYHL